MNVHSDFGKIYLFYNISLLIAGLGIFGMIVSYGVRMTRPILWVGSGCCAIAGLLLFIMMLHLKSE